MRHCLCECTVCHTRQQYAFDEPYPCIGDSFPRPCNQCGEITPHTRVLTKKAMAELRAAEEEAALRQGIVEKCERMYGDSRYPLQQILGVEQDTPYNLNMPLRECTKTGQIEH